ncbi:MAG: glycoside hydrolase family 130 protein, partial [Planctomycetota bacterium]
GFFGNVVFTCGLLYEQQKLKVYYGVADTSIAYAEIPLQDVLENLNL